MPVSPIHTQFITFIEEPNYMSDKLADHYTDILSILGEDVSRGGLVDTPKRAAKAMQFLTDGYEKDLDGVVNGAIFEADTDEMVIVQDIEFYSLCEHHILPFIGRCHIAYLPNGKVLGLSKFARIVDMYARRLQIQEGLTKQIADAVQKVTGASGVGVIMEGKHMCMMMRGVQKQNSSMITSVMLGSMRTSDATRNEFLRLIGK
jgi:GTP cyclohydrolase I